jgi:glyoxylase-like metal-dependent hydrolase (beta-lactamase superfamily II)
MSDPVIHVYCGGLFQTNGYLVRKDGGTWLFDAPEGITGWLEDHDVVPDALLLTHQHHDHVLDVARIQAVFGCPVYAHSDPSDELTLSKGLERMMGIPCPIDPYTVDQRFAGLDTIDLGGLVLDLHHVPGHSPDSVCFKLRDQPVLIGGDVLFAGGIGRTDFPNGNHGLLLSGIRSKLWPLPDETRVLPGHGPETTIGEEKATNPFLA